MVQIGDYTVIQKPDHPPDILSYSTVIWQRILPKVYDMFEKVRGCEQQLNPRAIRHQRIHLTL